MTEKVNPWKLSEQNKNIMKYIPAWSSHEQLFYYLAQKLCFWTGIIFIGVYVSVCVSVCLSVSLYIDYLKKLLTDFDETWQDDV